MRHLIATSCLSLAVLAAGQAWSAPDKPAAPARPAAAADPSLKQTVAQIMDHDLTSLEKEIVPAAEAMPEDKFNFAPTQGEFKGVLTFAQQIKHFSHDNYLMFAALLGEKLPPSIDPKEKGGLDKMTSKADILKYLKDSFAMGHRAMATLSEANLAERIANPYGNGPGPTTRLAAANESLSHSYNHYGQMVEYLRMNGIIPPASRRPPQ